ncbi:MAG: 3-deoxy-manno-octulosonate cytidylyltransferase [Clostridiaceae bacterium]|nr:3-deoxy-manno-octulosonate cytidylyltransferase [Clostridiaceae bacterium]
MKIVGVIPARYKSSRFPGKPLEEILEKPLVWWVYQQAIKVKEFAEVYVATDDKRIEKKCIDLGINVIMTSTEHATGTDRVAEVAQKVSADLYVNIQGDEPLLQPETIIKAIEPFYKNKNLKVSNLMTKIKNQAEIINGTIPKVVVNDFGIGIFLSRSPIPYPKGITDIDYYKAVCVYGFKPEALEFFASQNRGYLEKCEDIELLRFIENGIEVKFIEVEQDTVAVDTPKDLEKVREIITKNIN